MPTASAKGVREYLELKGVTEARGFQKVRTKEWLDEKLEKMPFSDH